MGSLATGAAGQSGSERSRHSWLTIEGPSVAISVKLASNGWLTIRDARRFAASINMLSQQLVGETIR